MTDRLMPILPINSPLSTMLAHVVTGQLSPALVPEAQWDELIELAISQGVGGMLLWALRRAGWDTPPEPRWQPLLSLARGSGRYSLLLEKTRRQVAASFDRAVLPAIWLKGGALAYTHYPEPHLRPMSDLDVLVPPDRMIDAREVLQSLGFRPAEIDFFELSGFTDQARHHESMLDRTGKIKLELHFRMLVPSLHYHMTEKDLEWFWGQTEDLGQNGPSFRALKPEANLLYLCAHIILQHQGEQLDLLHLLDLHLLITQSQMDWDLVLKQAVALRWTVALEAALAFLPGLYGTVLPDGLLEELRRLRPAGEIPSQYLDTLHSTRRWDEWRQAFERMPLGRRLRLVRSTLFPPEVFLRQQYHLAPGQLLFPYYVYHFLSGWREVARAMRQGAVTPKQRAVRGGGRF